MPESILFPLQESGVGGIMYCLTPSKRNAILTYALQYPNFVGPVALRIDHVHRTGNAGIQRVHGPQNLQRLVDIHHRGVRQGGFSRPRFVGGTPWAEIPGGGHHHLVVGDDLIVNINPVAQRAPGRLGKTHALDVGRPARRRSGAGVASRWNPHPTRGVGRIGPRRRSRKERR